MKYLVKDSEEQLEKINCIFVTLLVSHLEISGKLDNDEQPKNI